MQSRRLRQTAARKSAQLNAPEVPRIHHPLVRRSGVRPHLVVVARFRNCATIAQPHRTQQIKMIAQVRMVFEPISAVPNMSSRFTRLSGKKKCISFRDSCVTLQKKPNRNKDSTNMSRTDIIRTINILNQSAQVDFLQHFSTEELTAYLEQLRSIPSEPFCVE